MKTCEIRLASKLLATAWMVLLISACSHASPPANSALEYRSERPPLPRIVQLNFGSDASFFTCIDPLCPAVTKKSIFAVPHMTTDPLPLARSLPSESNTDPTLHTVLSEFPVSATDTVSKDRRLVILFAQGSAALSAYTLKMLDSVTPLLQEGHQVLITGRTDRSGSYRVNQRLALARANAVRDYLQTKQSTMHVEFKVDAQGKCCFTTSNDTAEGRRKSRRVEIVFSVPEQVTR